MVPYKTQDRLLQYNHATNMYEIQEANIVYSMDLRYTELVKQYIKTNKNRPIADWHSNLNETIKAKINISTPRY